MPGRGLLPICQLSAPFLVVIAPGRCRPLAGRPGRRRLRQPAVDQSMGRAAQLKPQALFFAGRALPSPNFPPRIGLLRHRRWSRVTRSWSRAVLSAFSTSWRVSASRTRSSSDSASGDVTAGDSAGPGDDGGLGGGHVDWRSCLASRASDASSDGSPESRHSGIPLTSRQARRPAARSEPDLHHGRTRNTARDSTRRHLFQAVAQRAAA